MDVWTFLGGLTMGAAAAAIYDMGSSPKMMGDKRDEEGTMFNGSFLGGVRIRGLGQAQMRAGSGFSGPFGMYSDIGPAGGYNPPTGLPATTQEEIQSYICPDGSHQSMTRAEAMAQGCTLAPATGPITKGPPRLMGAPSFLGEIRLVTRPSMGAAAGPSSPGTTSAPAGSPTGQQIAQAGQPVSQPSNPLNQLPFPGYPTYYPPQPSSNKLTCKKKVDADGNETFECEPKVEPAPAAARYPVYFVNPMFY